MQQTTFPPLLVSPEQQEEEVAFLSYPNPLIQKNTKRRRTILFAALVVTCLSIGLVIGVLIPSDLYHKSWRKHVDIAPEEDVQLKANRPVFHIMPEKGWINDPNGLIVRDGVYHTFYQYNPVNNSWDWSIEWGHAVSTDLVHWTNVAVALTPSAHGADCSGCWSGCMTLNDNGDPVIVYTGITTNISNCYVTQAQQNWNYNQYNGYRETVMYALTNPLMNSPDLVSWSQRGILIEGPPSGDTLQGWRDPFVYQRGGVEEGADWILIIGTGRMTANMTSLGGAVMVYSAHSLFSDWTFQGYMLEGTPQDGLMWECPWMVEITPQVGTSDNSHILGVGGAGWQKVYPSERNEPILYYMGHFNQTSWKFQKTVGPLRFDLGELFYAANRMIDGNGRVIIWGWLRECKFQPRDHICDLQDYAGSLSIPRVISVSGDILRQDPPEEFKLLRGGLIALQNTTQLVQTQFTVFDVNALNMEFEITLQRVGADVSGLLLDRSNTSMLLLYNWQTSELRAIKAPLNILQVVDPISPSHTLEQYSGQLANMKDSDTISFRVFIDGSVVEVFTSSGQVMSLRLYHGLTAPSLNQVLQVVSYNGGTNVVNVSAWNMKSIWVQSNRNFRLARALQQTIF